jgi:hypothetical protein
MQYQKPRVVQLGVRGRSAVGGPEGCVAGPAAGDWESCGAGTSAGWGCVTGGAAGAYTSCMNGAAASTNGDCLNGSGVRYYCEAGIGGGDDPYGCNVGPSYT